MRFPVVTGLLAFSLASPLAVFVEFLPGERSDTIGNGSSSCGFGCISINGSSATKSL